MRGTMGERRGKERLGVPDIGHHREWEPIYIYIYIFLMHHEEVPLLQVKLIRNAIFSLENKPGSMG